MQNALAFQVLRNQHNQSSSSAIIEALIWDRWSSMSSVLTFVLLSESVDPEAEAVVEAEPRVLADDDVARAYYPVRLLPNHRRLACERGGIQHSRWHKRGQYLCIFKVNKSVI